MSGPTPKRENLLVNLLFNALVPFVLLTQLSKETRLGPFWGLVVSLLFPLGYGIYDLIVRRKANALSIIGITGILINGTLGMLKFGGIWFAVKEVAMSTIIGIALLVTMRSKESLVRTMLFNETVMDVDRIEAALRERGTEAEFAVVLRNCTFLLAGAFLASGLMGFALARYLLKSPGGTPEFNAELGKMHLLSWPVLVLPAMAMMMVAFWRLLAGLRRVTGLTTDQIMRSEEEKK